MQFQDPYVPDSANKCVTKVAEAVKHHKFQNKLKTQEIQYAKDRAKYAKKNKAIQDKVYWDTQAEDRKPTHSVYLAGGATPTQDGKSKGNQVPHDCEVLVCPYVREQNGDMYDLR